MQSLIACSALALGVTCVLTGEAIAAPDAEYDFDVPSQNIEAALGEFHVGLAAASPGERDAFRR